MIATALQTTMAVLRAGLEELRKDSPTVNDVHVNKPLGAVRPKPEDEDEEVDVDELFKYSPDQPRDYHGRFGEGGDGPQQGNLPLEPKMALTATNNRAWNGKQVEVKNKLSKLETGRIGEEAVLAYLQAQGFKDARPLNDKQNNFPVDMVQDHGAIEVKAGLVSNGPSAQQWRATIGQPGPSEREWLKTADAKQKSAWNLEKQQAILDRKSAALKTLSKELGKKVQGYTMTTLINPDTKTVDIYKFDGFHLRIPWNGSAAKGAYVGSFKYK